MIFGIIFFFFSCAIVLVLVHIRNELHQIAYTQLERSGYEKAFFKHMMEMEKVRHKQYMEARSDG